MKNKRGQFQISFGVIFSLFLIGVFVFVAVYIIAIFLGWGDQIKTGIFINDFENEVREYWRAPGGGEKTVRFELKSEEITHICFFNPELEQFGPYEEQYEEIKSSFSVEENFYFYPRRYAQPNSAVIKHIDMEAFNANPYCIESVENVFKVKMKKTESDFLVKISRV
jgi:hypothetical protein